MYLSDTIAAVATPVGSGGIGIVRISGPCSEKIGTEIFCGTKGGGFESHRLYYGRFINPVDGSLIDEGMAVLMRAPRSYTREDVLELHCHGGYLVVRSLLQAAVSAGARLAEPGEFTRRAFLNGRIDLAQAESVLDVINSRTDRALALAQRQREGQLGSLLGEVRSLAGEALAVIEAHIDFPEEDLDPASLAMVSDRTAAAGVIVRRLVESFRYGKVLREGVSVLLAGKPNAGKSSLLNALLSEERAIVSAIPGTTRDMIEEVIAIDGLPVRIIDAAGIRRTHDDEVEREGIRRTLERLSEADLVLFLIDGSGPLDHDDQEILEALSGRQYIVVVTKDDLDGPHAPDTFSGCHAQIRISAKTGYNIDALRSLVFSFFTRDVLPGSEDLVAISSARHHDILIRATGVLHAFQTHLDAGYPPELLAADLREFLSAVGEITGATTPDDVLDLIFSTFCIGK